MKTIFSFAVVVCLALTIGLISAQSPTPDLIIQAATPAGVVPSAATGKAATGDTKNLKEMLMEMKATNETTIQKQKATLQTLDELQKAAEEIKIFSKRG